LHSLHGSDGVHFTRFVRLGGSVPVTAGLGVGGDVALLSRTSKYPAEIPVNQQISRVRGYLLWIP
jgi:hypothetical protein